MKVERRRQVDGEAETKQVFRKWKVCSAKKRFVPAKNKATKEKEWRKDVWSQRSDPNYEC